MHTDTTACLPSFWPPRSPCATPCVWPQELGWHRCGVRLPPPVWVVGTCGPLADSTLRGCHLLRGCATSCQWSLASQLECAESAAALSWHGGNRAQAVSSASSGPVAGATGSGREPRRSCRGRLAVRQTATATQAADPTMAAADTVAATAQASGRAGPTRRALRGSLYEALLIKGYHLG